MNLKNKCAFAKYYLFSQTQNRQAHVVAAELRNSHLIMPLPTREQQIQSLHSTHEFDVLVIGGGATGCGVALDAVSRGT